MGYNPYYEGGWKSGKEGGTPITPEALNHIEAGIEQTYSDFAPIFKESLANCSENDILEPGGYVISSANYATVTDGAPELANYARWLYVLNFDTEGDRVLQLEGRSTANLSGYYANDLFYRHIITGTPHPWKKLSSDSCVPLWKNASPTSGFAAQTITVSGLSECSAVFVNFKNTEAATNYRVASLLITKNALNDVTAYVTQVDYGDGVIGYYQRQFKVQFDSNKIIFANATYNESQTFNAKEIPYEIIGVKGAS